MVQTFQGYFQEGRFVSPQTDSIPEYVEVYVVVTNNPVTAKKTEAQKQRQAFELFCQAISNAQPLGEEFDKIINQGISVQGVLNS